MRILFFVHRYWPSLGGVETYVHELGRALIKLGHEVDVVAGAHVHGLPPAESHEGISIHRFPAQRSPLRCRLWFWRRRGLFARADVINVSNTHMLEYYWRMIGLLVTRWNVFLTRHGMAFIHPVPESHKCRAFRAQKLAVGTAHDGRFIEKWLGVKPDACPDQGLSPPADELEPVPEPSPGSAVYIGRLEPYTGIRTYLDAVARLNRRRREPFELNIYGDGSLMPELRALVARDSLPVRLHGKTPDAQRHIADSCFAFLDGRMAVQEAMARRRLVFAAYGDPLRRDYVAGESFSPYLITVANGAELGDRVSHFIDHPDERSRMVARAFEHARSLSWDRTARAYVSLWEDRLTRPGVCPSLLKSARLAWAIGREARIEAGLQKVTAQTCTACHNDKSPTFSADEPLDFEKSEDADSHKHVELEQCEG